MNLRASSIGDLAARRLSKGGAGEVTRVFQRSTYVRAGVDFILLLWGGLRSPMTINVEESYQTGWRTRVGERCILSRGSVTLDAGRIDVRGAEVFSSALLYSRRVTLPKGPALAKGVAMLRSLYDVSPSGPTLVADPVLKSFVRDTLLPLSFGRPGAAYQTGRYLRLIGRGSGFTPSGDDFVGGFLATFNYVARCQRKRQVLIPRTLLRGRTVPESAMILSHSARGRVDESMERLVLATTRGAGFYDELVTVARRGHTSGIDMSLGVLLCEAALSQESGERGALQRCLDELW